MSQRSGLLKFINLAQKRDGKVGPAFFTRLVQKANDTQEIRNLLEEAKTRFGSQLPWQLLASAAHRSASKEVSDPELGASLLQQIPNEDVLHVHEGVLRAVLGCASKHNVLKSAQLAFDMLPVGNITLTDKARLIHAGVDTNKAMEMIEQVLSVPLVTEKLDIRVLGVFLKFCHKCNDIELAKRVWEWGEFTRKYSDDKHSIGLITLQFLLLCGRTGHLQLAQNVWQDAVGSNLHTLPEVLGAMLSVLASHGAMEETSNLLSQIPPQQINAHMLTAALTAYSHNGCADEALALLQKVNTISRAYGTQVVGLNAYTAVVDAFARKGKFDSAIQVIQKAQENGITPDIVMWITVLSPCRHYGALSIAEKVFNTIKSFKSSSEELAAAYVLMADVYKACGQSHAAETLQKERLTRRLIKERGAVTTTVGGETYTFYVNEIPQVLSTLEPDIQTKLDEWSVWLTSQGVSIESIQCRHSENLALAYAVCAKQKHVVLRKNLRICTACHEASRHITILEGITIHHWDRSRVHVMTDGRCSCSGYY